MTPLETLRSLAHRVLDRLAGARPAPQLVPLRVEAARRRLPSRRR